MSENQTAPEQVQPDFCMTITDDSMKPDGIHKGDTVAFVACDRVENGQIAAVKVGDKIFVRTVWADGQLLAPSNPAYMCEVFRANELPGVQIIGRAVEVRHILNPARSPESTPPQNDPQGVPV